MDRTITHNPGTSSAIPTLIGFQWRAYWRRLARGGKLTVGNQGLGLIVIGLILFRYVKMLRVAAIDIASGKTALLESMLAGIFIAWLVITNSREQRSVASSRWLHLPLSLKGLLVIRASSLLMPPTAWFVLAGSLAICYPLAHGQRPFMGIAAAFLFVLMSWLGGLTVGSLLSLAWGRRVLGAAVLPLMVGAGIYILNHEIAGPADLSALLPLTPMALVGRAALGQDPWTAILLLALFTAVALSAALWSLQKSLASASPRGAAKARFAQLHLPGRLGGLVAKDVRYFWRLLDAYLGLLAAATGCVYLVTADEPSLDIFLVFLTMVFLPVSPLAFNCFGLDTPSGLDRYTLLPLSGRSIVLSKNLAFLSVAGVQAFPLMILACSQLGFVAGAVGLAAFISLAAACLTWGNWMSLSHAMKLQFFRFSSSSVSIFDAMAGVIFSSSPGVIIIYLLHAQPQATWAIALVPVLFATLYFLSLLRAGKRFARKLETIARALA
jgi:hypothetical protein